VWAALDSGRARPRLRVTGPLQRSGAGRDLNSQSGLAPQRTRQRRGAPLIRDSSH
jgi:hypothetical protein